MNERNEPGTDSGNQVTIRLNGADRLVSAGTTVMELLTTLAVDVRQVAVERNLKIVPKYDYQRTVLLEGDRLEVVTFVGGG